MRVKIWDQIPMRLLNRYLSLMGVFAVWFISGSAIAQESGREVNLLRHSPQSDESVAISLVRLETLYLLSRIRALVPTEQPRSLELADRISLELEQSLLASEDANLLRKGLNLMRWARPFLSRETDENQRVKPLIKDLLRNLLLINFQQSPDIARQGFEFLLMDLKPYSRVPDIDEILREVLLVDTRLFSSFSMAREVVRSESQLEGIEKSRFWPSQVLLQAKLISSVLILTARNNESVASAFREYATNSLVSGTRPGQKSLGAMTRDLGIHFPERAVGVAKKVMSQYPETYGESEKREMALLERFSTHSQSIDFRPSHDGNGDFNTCWDFLSSH